MINENETVREFIDRVWGKCSKEQMEGLLWHCTAFPCVDAEELERQLVKVKEQSGDDYDVAMAQAEEQIEQALAGKAK